MTAQKTSLFNAFETQLSASVGAADLTFNVDATAPLTSPCYLVIDPTSASKREYVLFDGTFTSTAFVTTSTANRGLGGSAAGAQAHAAGTTVRCVPMHQHFGDLNDRIDVHVDDVDLGAAGPHSTQFAATVPRSALPIVVEGGAGGDILQALGDARSEGRGLLIGKGEWELPSSISLASSDQIEGVGTRKTILRRAGTGTFPLIASSGTALDKVRSWRIANLTLDGGNAAGTGLDLTHAVEGDVRGMAIRNFTGNGVLLDQSWSIGINASHIRYNGVNLHLGAEVNDVLLNDVSLDRATTYGLYVPVGAVCRGLQLVGPVIQSCGLDAVYVAGSLQGCGWFGGYLEDNNLNGDVAASDVRIAGGQGIHIAGVEVLTKAANAVFHLDAVTGFTVNGGAALKLAGATNATLVRTTAATRHVMLQGLYREGLTHDDVGTAITDHTLSGWRFRESGGVRTAYASWAAQSPDATTDASMLLQHGDVTAARWYAAGSSVYFGKNHGGSLLNLVQFDGNGNVQSLRRHIFGNVAELTSTFEHKGTLVGFYGVAPVARPTALTAADAATVDATYGTEEAGVINNLRTRVNELETKLRSLGLLS